jgi:hypothetical protein
MFRVSDSIQSHDADPASLADHVDRSRRVASVDLNEVIRDAIAAVIAPLDGEIAALEGRLAVAERRATAQEIRIATLESDRPGRKPIPLVATRQRGVCAVDPDRDSGACADASIYRYQRGCHGEACRGLPAAAYQRRRANKGNARQHAQEIRTAWWAGEAIAVELAEMYGVGDAYVQELLRRRTMKDLPLVEHEGTIMPGAPIRDYERIVGRPRSAS